MTTTVGRRRRLRPEQRRALIVEAAAAEFGRCGHRDARMEDIARAAGITKAVLYDHFPNKGALHAEVVSRASEELVGTVVAAVVAAEGDPESRFRAGLLTSFRVIEQRPDVRTLLLGEPGADQQVGKASMEAQRGARAAMAALYLSEPAFLPRVRDRKQRAEHLAQAIIGTINALAALGVEQKLSPERLTDLAMQLLWPGIEAMLQPDPGRKPAHRR
jgi:AcrR family transcriptional regulator